jgi:poly(hydroxyalkanoate) granule-associated protein
MAGRLKQQRQEAESASRIMDIARQVYLAGVGALARTQAESSQLFTSLVEEGLACERRSRSVATEQVSGMVDRVGENWGQVEKIFENRVAQATARLGIPTRQDVESLTARVEALTRQVAELQALQLGQASTKPTKAAPARRTSASRKKPPAESS